MGDTKRMNLPIVILGASVVVIAACSSATSVDAVSQAYCDKAAACKGDASAEQVASCKQLATGYDKQLKTECVAPYARAFDCVFAQATCTNGELKTDDAKAEAACKTQAEEAAKCQPWPFATTGVQTESVGGRLVVGGRAVDPAARSDVFRALSDMIATMRPRQ